MRRTALAAACLSAMLGAGALAAASASAAPVFYTKAAVDGTTPLVPYTATLGAGYLETEARSRISCTGGTATGEVTGPTTTANDVLTLTGCETSGIPCSPITTSVLEGSLGAVTSTLPGLRLYRTGERGRDPKTGALMEIECGSGLLRAIVTGSVIGSLAGAYGMTVSEGKLPAVNKLIFVQSAGLQKYTSFLAGEGEPGVERLALAANGGRPEATGLSVVMTIQSVPAGDLGYTK